MSPCNHMQEGSALETSCTPGMHLRVAMPPQMLQLGAAQIRLVRCITGYSALHAIPGLD